MGQIIGKNTRSLVFISQAMPGEQSVVKRPQRPHGDLTVTTDLTRGFPAK